MEFHFYLSYRFHAVTSRSSKCEIGDIDLIKIDEAYSHLLTTHPRTMGDAQKLRYIYCIDTYYVEISLALLSVSGTV